MLSAKPILDIKTTNTLLFLLLHFVIIIIIIAIIIIKSLFDQIINNFGQISNKVFAFLYVLHYYYHYNYYCFHYYYYLNYYCRAFIII